MSVDQVIQNPITLILLAFFVLINVTQKRVDGQYKLEGAAVAMQTAYVNLSDKRMDELELRVEKLQVDLDAARKSEQDKNQLIDDLQSEVDGLRNEVRLLKDKVNNMDEEKRHLLEENGKLRTERDEYQRRALAAEAKALALQEIIDRLTKPSTSPLDPTKLDPPPAEGKDHA